MPRLKALKYIRATKDFLLFFNLLIIFRPFKRFLAFALAFNDLAAYLRRHKKDLLVSDFYTPRRNYNKRYDMFKTVSGHYQLDTSSVLYLEFGVASALSFKWWLAENRNPESSFYGFDTFEGLPESWNSIFAKGDMAAEIPQLADKRAGFLKGIFQDTLHPFIQANQELLKQDRRKIIHMDADLFSSTIFVLSQLYPYLKKGDLVFFDEFNVANHEWKAFDIFTRAFYVKMKPVAAVNNFYQTVFILE